MKILLTGGAGFIGSNFILNFIDNHQILNYDLVTYAGSNNNLDSIKQKEFIMNELLKILPLLLIIEYLLNMSIFVKSKV